MHFGRLEVSFANPGQATKLLYLNRFELRVLNNVFGVIANIQKFVLHMLYFLLLFLLSKPLYFLSNLFYIYTCMHKKLFGKIL